MAPVTWSAILEAGGLPTSPRGGGDRFQRMIRSPGGWREQRRVYGVSVGRNVIHNLGSIWIETFGGDYNHTRREDAIGELSGHRARIPLFVLGDALDVLREFPPDTFDCCMTSPPYWGKREYANSGIGLERDYRDFIHNLGAICAEIKRVLKPAGSFWLNIGDSYAGKNLIGIPWRIAIELMDEQGWILRNNVIWNKVKGGPDNTKDRLRNIHEDVFHFVKSPRGYYYDTDAIRSTPKQAKVVNGSVVSPREYAGFGTGGKSSCLRISPKRKRQMPSARWSRCSAVLPLVRLPISA